MKYKVIYSINYSGGGNPDGMTSCSFYTKSQAIASAQAWAEKAPALFYADVWDGSIWTRYEIPA